MCHSPRTETSQLDKERDEGRGADSAPEAGGEWHKAPDITGGRRLWERWGEAAMVKFMTTGLTPKGTASDPQCPATR